MNRLRLFGVIKIIKDETVTCTSWPKAALMRKVGFIDRKSGRPYPTEGKIKFSKHSILSQKRFISSNNFILFYNFFFFL